jgi:hypothetical protein
MAALLEANVEAVEVEAFAKEIPDTIGQFQGLYNLFKANATYIPISNTTLAGSTARGSFRVPFRVQRGAPGVQASGDRSSLGPGTGSNWQGFVLSPVGTFSVCEVSWLAKKSTEGKNRALFSVQAQELKNSLKSFLNTLEGQFNSDGSGVIDTIPTTATVQPTYSSATVPSYISGLNTVAGFVDQQQVLFYPSVGGTVASSTPSVITYVDVVSQTLFFNASLPGAVTNGYLIMINGSSGAAGNSIMGIRAWDVNGNTGTLAGINRALYPSRISTPTINLNGGAITPGLGLRAEILLGRALGQDAESIQESQWYGPPEQAYAIGNLFFNVNQAFQRPGDGTDKPLDMGRKTFQDQFAGRKYNVGYAAQPNRVDLLHFPSWYLGELVAPEIYNFGDAGTVVPVPDTSSATGTYYTSFMFAYSSSLNIACSAPRMQLYIQNAGVPTV